MSLGSRSFLALIGAGLLVGSGCPAVFAADPPTNANAQTAPAKPASDKSAAEKATTKPNTDDKAANAKTAAAKKAAVKPAPTKAHAPAPLSADREAAALAFAREHHPELAALIDKLHRDNRREYDRAIRQLWPACERLTRLKKVSPQQYELSLTAWKLDSRTQLLAARMTVSPTPGLEAELKQLLAERADVRLKEYKFERAQLQERLSKVNASIQSLETDKNGLVEKDLLRIKRSVAARSRRPSPRPANKSSPSAIASKAPITEPPPPALPTTAASVAPPADASAASRTADKQH